MRLTTPTRGTASGDSAPCSLRMHPKPLSPILSAPLSDDEGKRDRMPQMPSASVRTPKLVRRFLDLSAFEVECPEGTTFSCMMQASGDYFFCCQILSEPTAIVLFLPQNSRGEARDGMCLALRCLRERQAPRARSMSSPSTPWRRVRP